MRNNRLLTIYFHFSTFSATIISKKTDKVHVTSNNISLNVQYTLEVVYSYRNEEKNTIFSQQKWD